LVTDLFAVVKTKKDDTDALLPLPGMQHAAA